MLQLRHACACHPRIVAQFATQAPGGKNGSRGATLPSATSSLKQNQSKAVGHSTGGGAAADAKPAVPSSVPRPGAAVPPMPPANAAVARPPILPRRADIGARLFGPTPVVPAAPAPPQPHPRLIPAPVVVPSAVASPPSPHTAGMRPPPRPPLSPFTWNPRPAPSLVPPTAHPAGPAGRGTVPTPAVAPADPASRSAAVGATRPADRPMPPAPLAFTASLTGGAGTAAASTPLSTADAFQR